MSSLSSSFVSYRHRACATSGHRPAKKHFGMDGRTLNPAGKTSTPTSHLDNDNTHNTGGRMTFERQRKIMAELKAELDTAVKGKPAPAPQTIHPFDVIGGTKFTFHYEKPPAVGTDTTPTQLDLYKAVGLPTLDLYETDAGNLFLGYISAYESTLVDEVTVYPERRVKVMRHVCPTKAEYRALRPIRFNMNKHWRAQVVRDTPEPPNINPRLAQRMPDFQFDIHKAAKEHWIVLSPDNWHERNIITEHDYQPPSKRRCHHNRSPPTHTPNTNPSHPTPLTKSLSNLDTALLLLFRWFDLPMAHLTTIINHAFATGLDPITCAIRIRAAKLNRTPEYIDVFENTTWSQRRRHHAGVFRLLSDAADELGLAMPLRRTDIEICIVDRRGRGREKGRAEGRGGGGGAASTSRMRGD